MAQTGTRTTHRSRSARDSRLPADVLERLPIAVAVIDAEGRHVSANHSYLSLLGYSAADLYELSLCDMCHPADADAYEHLGRVAGGALDLVEFEARLRCSDGDYVWAVIRIGGRDGDASSFVATFEDVSDRKAAEIETRVVLKRLGLVESVIDGAVYEYDPSKSSVRWTSGIAEVFGYEGQKTSPMSWLRERVHPEDWSTLREALRACENGSDEYHVEYRFQRADGSYADVVDRALIFRDESGRIARSVGVMVDESLRRSAEEERREFLRRVEAAASTLNGLVYEYDARHDTMLLMGGMVSEVRITPASGAISDWMTSRIHPDDVQSVHDRLQLAIAGGSDGGSAEYRMRLSDDQPWLDIWDTYRIIRNDSGRFVALAGTLVDVTARRQLAETSRETELRYQALVEQIPAYVAAADGQGSILYLSPKSADIMGLDPLEATIPDIWARMLHPEDKQRVISELRSSIEDGREFSTQYRLLRGDGEQVWVQSEAAVIRDEENLPVFVQGVMFDITDQKRQESELFDANEKLVGWVAELEERDREITLLSEMGELLQACVDEGEAYEVIRPYVSELFSSLAGTVSICRSNKSLLETVAFWGHEPDDMFFAAEDCWGLRRGRVHQVKMGTGGMACRHLIGGDPAAHICVPLLSKGEALGLLHVAQLDGTALNSDRERLAITVGEHLALSMANLKLRETLRLQSIRDPLTGLFNRRYMEESLDRELSRADRSGKPLSVMMLDLDHFKQFNDSFGHDAGDALLTAVGDYLRGNTRTSDIVCRYGGEEMVVILPDASEENAIRRAEALRSGIRALEVRSRGASIGQVTVSIGIAVYPDHARSGPDVLKAADIALYEAKHTGRDRVVVAGERALRRLSA